MHIKYLYYFSFATTQRELNKIDDYDAVISTTIVPDSIKDKVIQGLPLLNGMGVDQVYDQLKTRLGL